MTLTEKVRALAEDVVKEREATEALRQLTVEILPHMAHSKPRRGPGYGTWAACREYSGILRGMLYQYSDDREALNGAIQAWCEILRNQK